MKAISSYIMHVMNKMELFHNTSISGVCSDTSIFRQPPRVLISFTYIVGSILVACSIRKYIVTCQAHPALVKKANQMCGSFLFKFLSMFGPPVDGPKEPWPRVLSLPERFVGDPASLARDNILPKG